SLNSLWVQMQREMAGRGDVNTADFTRAQRAVDQWLLSQSSRADQVQGLLWQGKLYSLARDYPRSRAAFRKAVELDPAHLLARELLAISLVRESPTEAAAHLQVVRQRDPKNAKIIFLLATVLRDLGELDQAEVLLDEVLAKDPEDIPVLVERGRVALDQGRPKDAELWLQRAVALN